MDLRGHYTSGAKKGIKTQSIIGAAYQAMGLVVQEMKRWHQLRKKLSFRGYLCPPMSLDDRHIGRLGNFDW
jgi:hypothetical protein